jgi:hypothetical protein
MLASVALLLATGAPARAGSIAFLRAGRPWTAKPEGCASGQLPADGGYSYISASKAPGTTPSV